ncbi:ankyrin repeat-containing protein [Recurvomyces mirabilis]|uniref:Ankyrin repeat-containing protein n=1 Tax=Recurvomyces mirabilis TaxID=574656 RepID=A0AAE0WXG9_9PEZI|nr:ankyrin repeat-containing protein [Recurvomyces mirabilis]KAK5161862.1 ankyrin repeat-containing protein [Recurvomyces mirabilis]
MPNQVFFETNRDINMAGPAVTIDEIDDVLYFTRINEAQDLQQTLTGLSQKYGCQVKDVLEACIDPETGNTLLHFCSANGFVELLQNLLIQLKSGGNGVAINGKAADRPHLINRQNQQGSTPLHWAAYNGQLDAVKLLVKEGSDMWIKNSAGHLAMFEAERADKSEVVQFLLEAGGKEVEKTGREGQADTAEDVEEADVSMHPGELDGNGSNGGQAQAAGGAAVEMGEA